MTARQAKTLVERSLRTGAYWMVAVAGFATIMWTPRTISEALGGPMSIVWGVLLLSGGLVAAFASTIELYLFEYPAIPIIVTGLGLYLIALWHITVDGEVTRLSQTALITAYALHLVARAWQLRTLMKASPPH